MKVQKRYLHELSKTYNCEFDDRGNIGKTISEDRMKLVHRSVLHMTFDSEEDGAVTVRDRDTMEQERVKIEDLKAYFAEKFDILIMRKGTVIYMICPKCGQEYEGDKCPKMQWTGSHC